MTLLQPGIYQNISFPEYNALPHIRNSYLKKIEKCPAAAKIDDDKDTQALIIGRATHAMTLEGDNAFHSDFVVLPADAPKKPTITQINAAKPSAETVHAVNWWNMFVEQSRGKQIITRDDYTILAGMRDSVKSHPFARRLLEDTVSEQTVIFNYTASNGLILPCKCRPDSTPSPSLRCLIDLKSTEDASYEGFLRSCFKFGYFHQAAYYIDGYNAARDEAHPAIDAFAFIVIEKKPPHRCEVYTLMGDNSFLLRGREQYQRNLDIEANCRALNYWPNYQDAGAQELLPFAERNI